MPQQLNEVVERLLVDDRFMRRFRRNPEKALRKYDLTREEIEAVKAGRTQTLLELGLDPALVWPRAEADDARRGWFTRNALAVGPAALLVALVMGAAAAPSARAIPRERRTGLRRAVGRMSPRARVQFVAGLRRAHAHMLRAGSPAAARLGGRRRTVRRRIGEIQP